MNFRSIVCAAGLALFTVSPSHAVPVELTVESGVLKGAKYVDVDGVLFDVTFRDSTCVALFDGCDESSDFTFTTLEDATKAATALMQQVFVGEFDDDPTKTEGISYVFGYAMIPYGFIPNSVGVWMAVASNNTFEGSDQVLHWGYDPTVDTSNPGPGVPDFRNYALFSPTVVSSVPLPPSIALFLTGLAGLAGFSRWKKRTA